MIALIFWNICKNPIQNEIADLVVDVSSEASLSGHSGEVLLGLAEPDDIDDAGIIALLTTRLPNFSWWARWSLGKRFLLIGNIQAGMLTSFPEEYGCFPNTLTRITNKPKVFPLWFVHLDSPLGVRSAAVHGTTEGTELRKSIDSFELKWSSVDTIAIGDFNMTPYDAGMVAPGAVNAVPCRSVAKKISRLVKRKKRTYFFNPMWELLGSVTHSQQPGTYFMRPKDDSTQWFLVDQAIVRPSMMSFINGHPSIITRVGTTSLLGPRSGINKLISDHLPVVLSLNI